LEDNFANFERFTYVKSRKNLSLRLKLANDGDKTTLSGREFQVVLTTRWEKKCASRAEGVKLFANM